MAATRGHPPVKVLFIAGWGRSGSTVLSNLIGSHEGAFSAGELNYFWRWAFVEGRRCGCGTPIVECAFWRDVFTAGFGDAPPDPQRMIALQREALGVKHTLALLADARRRRTRPKVAEYRDVMSKLLAGIAAVSGCRLVVDSSKRPPDAVAIGQVEGIDPYLLHMVRDPRAVAFSWRRHKLERDGTEPSEMTRHGLLMNSAHWLGWNLGAEWAAAAYPPGRYRRLRYEDFAARPRQTVERILRFVGEPVVDSPFRSDDTAILAPNHTVAGNPNRFTTGEVRLNRDDEWMSGQRSLVRCATTALALPLLGRYRYPVAVTG